MFFYSDQIEESRLIPAFLANVISVLPSTNSVTFYLEANLFPSLTEATGFKLALASFVELCLFKVALAVNYELIF